MKIKQLGNGGGLADPTEGHVNSSFLIDLHDNHSEYLLFDCGYNIMKRLVEEEQNNEHFEISKIKHVVISHKHDDHCGNLETLLYWNHFKNNVQMNFYVACKGLAKTIKDTRFIENNFKTIKAKTYESLEIISAESYIELKTNKILLEFCKAYHGSKKAIGLRVLQYDIKNIVNKSIFISGDTKAHKSIEQFATNCDLVFHDYSNWNDPSKNIHACESDFKSEYSKQFRTRVMKYHTGSLEFNKDWQ